MSAHEDAGHVSCVRHSPGSVYKKGYLTKLGGRFVDGSWKKRYMVLKEDLYYYDDEATYEKGKDAKGVIRLDSFFCVKKAGENKNREFTIFAMPKPLVCRAESKEELVGWLKAVAHAGR